MEESSEKWKSMMEYCKSFKTILERDEIPAEYYEMTLGQQRLWRYQQAMKHLDTK